MKVIQELTGLQMAWLTLTGFSTFFMVVIVKCFVVFCITGHNIYSIGLIMGSVRLII